MKTAATPRGLDARRAGAGLAMMAALLLAGCAAAPVPATVWLRLPAWPAGATLAGPAASPVASPAAATGAPSAAREVWQLAAPLPMPAHLDRDTVFVPQGAAGAVVQPLAGARWVEPLRDALPRLLREDLVRELGGQAVWTAPLPPGLVPTRLVRVEIIALEIAADGKALATQARWWIADARGARAPVAHEARFEVDAMAAGAGGLAAAEAWALAHRRAVALLAARIATTIAASS